MDPEDLGRKVRQNASAPALVVLTIGTTFKGAVDSVDDVQQELRNHPSYVHLDAALFGGYLPFTQHADVVSFRGDSGRGDSGRGDAATAGRYDSIAVSCHKFFGFPSPAGLFITTRRNYDEFNTPFSRIHNPEYIHQVPGTITCSRDAVKPAEFHYFTTQDARNRQIQDAKQMLKNTEYLWDQMRSRFPQISATRANRLSNTIYFRKPSETIVNKYSLATMRLGVAGKQREFAHAIVMPHVDREVLDEFLGDLAS